MTTELTPTITDDEVRDLPLSDARTDLLRELVAESGAAAEPPRRTRRWLAPVAAAAAVLAIAVPVGLGQLGDDDGGRGVDPGAPIDAAASSFQIRVVDVSSLDAGIDDAQQAQLDGFTCPSPPVTAPGRETQLACDAEGNKFLLEPAVVDGGVVSAEAVIPREQVNYVVEIRLDDEASSALAELSQELVGTTTMTGLVVDGEVISAPTFGGVISTGQLQLSGEFTERSAQALAARLVG